MEKQLLYFFSLTKIISSNWSSQRESGYLAKKNVVKQLSEEIIILKTVYSRM